MLLFEPNIIVIDDKQDEVQGIIDHYCNQGLGCKFYNADYIDGDSYPAIPYSDVNLIFLDLLYSDKDFDSEQCSNWIRTLIPEKSFYTLIIWTKDPSHAEDVLSELEKDVVNRVPFKYFIKSKVDFSIDSESKFDYSKLFYEIEDEMEKISSLKEISNWKKSIKGASNIVVGNLVKNSNPDNFIAKLQKIIIAHGGTSILNSTDFNYKRRILFDALDQVVISNTRSFVDIEEIDNMNKDQLYSLLSSTSSEIDKELNSWFHFKLLKDIPSNSILPGLICENKHSLFKKIYSITDDPKLNSRFLNQRSKDIEMIDIALVLTRPCDIAQGKFGKNIKLISGVLMKSPYRIEKGKNKGQIDFNGILPDSTKVFDHLHFDSGDTDVALLFDFRYAFSVPERIFINNFDNLKIFNKELLSEMQVEYSSYSSRLGITQII